MWAPVVERLAERFHVVTYDVRGAGGSSAPRGSAAYRLDRLADDFDAVCRAVAPSDPLRPVHLVGHDWGGIQGWEFVTRPRFAGRVASFTAIAGPALGQVLGPTSPTRAALAPPRPPGRARAGPAVLVHPAAVPARRPDPDVEGRPGRWPLAAMAAPGGGAARRRCLPGGDGVRRCAGRRQPLSRQHPAPSHPVAARPRPHTRPSSSSSRPATGSSPPPTTTRRRGWRRGCAAARCRDRIGPRGPSPSSSPAGWPSSPRRRRPPAAPDRRHARGRSRGARRETHEHAAQTPLAGDRRHVRAATRRAGAPRPQIDRSTALAQRQPRGLRASSGPSRTPSAATRRPRGPVAIVPAPYSRNWDRLTRALVDEHAGLRSDRGLPGSGERGDAVTVKLTPDKLARGRRWMLRFGEFDLDVEGSGARAAGARNAGQRTRATTGPTRRGRPATRSSSTRPTGSRSPTASPSRSPRPRTWSTSPTCAAPGTAPEFRVTRNAADRAADAEPRPTPSGPAPESESSGDRASEAGSDA